MSQYFIWANPKKKEWIECDPFDEYGFMFGAASVLGNRYTDAADAEFDVHVIAPAGGADELAGALAVRVALGVADALLLVRARERLEDLGRGALGVVVAEHMHDGAFLWLCVLARLPRLGRLVCP